MVKLEEVSLDHVEEEEYTDTDSSSVYSSDEDEDDVDNIESILDRVWALQDVIPAKTRKSIADKCSTVYGWGKTSANFLGNSAWVLTTSALLLVLPLMIELEHEQGLIEYEKMQQQSTQVCNDTGYCMLLESIQEMDCQGLPILTHSPQLLVHCYIDALSARWTAEEAGLWHCSSRLLKERIIHTRRHFFRIDDSCDLQRLTSKRKKKETTNTHGPTFYI